MNDDDTTARIAALEDSVANLSKALADAKAIVQQWTESRTTLSTTAAQARAKNQESGRGLLGAIFGSKFRSTMRSAAAASNAAIAKEVAQKRARIADGKHEAQELVRRIQGELTEKKLELKSAVAAQKTKPRANIATAKAASTSLDLLAKLKDAHAAGLLTDDEFEQKRQKLVANL
jgi:Short C-terminal domain